MKYRKHLDNVERISATHFSDKMIKLNSAERDVPLDDYIWGKYLENLKIDLGSHSITELNKRSSLTWVGTTDDCQDVTWQKNKKMCVSKDPNCVKKFASAEMLDSNETGTPRV